MDYEEKGVFNAAKRLGMVWCPWMGDWFNSYSPRNHNSNAEGTWHHWANLAAFILSHPATQEVAPELYRPDLAAKVKRNLYSGGEVLSDEAIARHFGDKKDEA